MRSFIACLLRAPAFVLATVLGLGTASAWGQYAPPANYYNTVTGNPATLKTELHRIAASNYWAAGFPTGTGHVSRSYDDCRQGLGLVDSKPDDLSKIVLAYNGALASSTWDGGDTWNREHRWPASIGLGSSGPDYSDMHQLKACNPSVNSSRGNDAYGTPTQINSIYGHYSGYFFPGDADVPATPDFGNDTGDCARVAFYMAVRYDGSESGTTDLELKNGQTDTTNHPYELGDLAAFLVWHYRDVPSNYERRRNHLIFSNADNPYHYQGNRNPFIDHPEYVWSIFGDGANDSELYVGTTAPANGASTATIDFGTVTVGSPLPAAQSITLTKAGSDPTYYSVTASGIATSSVTGAYNAFGAGAGTRVLSIGLAPGTTDTQGVKTGTVVIDNLDLSNQGTGTGALDGNDVITVTITVGEPCPVPFADSDRDGDVDQSDFAALQLCYSGFEPYADGCACFDRNGTGTIDPGDFEVFQNCVTSPGVQAAADCGD